MHHPSPSDPDDLEPDDFDDDGEFGTPVYQGTGLTVRALTHEQLADFLDTHAQEPARRLGAGWARLEPTPPPVPAQRSPDRPLPWRAAVVLAVAATALLTAAVGLHRAAPLLAGLAAGLVAGWRLRFRPSRDTRAWRDGARGERATARLLCRLARHGYTVFHDVAIPGTPTGPTTW